MIGVASSIVIIGMYFLINPWVYGFPPDLSPAVLGAITAVGSGVLAMLCMFSVWQSHSRLLGTVDELRASERDLERKVEVRTADLVESRERLALARDEALAANQHKSAFLANMSHELRTPLNAVIGFSEMLSQKVFGDLNEKQDEYVTDIHQSGKHLLSLINDILDLSKIEAGKLELALTSFPLEEVIDSALVLTRERAFGKGVDQRSEIDPDLGSIEADERKVKQVLVNLLSNAVKFTDADGVVTLRARRLEDGVEVAVSDTGIGIAAEEQALVFEEFRQVGTDDARRAEGTGLGLALVKRLVELHGGRLQLESELGSGSCFTFTLPLSVPARLRGGDGS
jgi:signal transduction histidine kinase